MPDNPLASWTVRLAYRAIEPLIGTAWTYFDNMGLDMYLEKRNYVKNWEHQSPTERHSITVKRGGKVVDSIKPERISYIVEEVGYWRKANAIHKWFVDNVQDGNDNCGDYCVSHEQIKTLLDTCKKVLKSCKLVSAKVRNGYTINKAGIRVYNLEKGKTIKDPSVAQELLPCEDGCFFGNTDYDQWYYEDIKHTIEVLEPLVNDEDGSIYYSSSW